MNGWISIAAQAFRVLNGREVLEQAASCEDCVIASKTCLSRIRTMGPTTYLYRQGAAKARGPYNNCTIIFPWAPRVEGSRDSRPTPLSWMITRFCTGCRAYLNRRRFTLKLGPVPSSPMRDAALPEGAWVGPRSHWASENALRLRFETVSEIPYTLH